MGAAIGVFEGAAALRVPRTRFAPVKTTNQLLVVRSDAYALARRLDGAARRGARLPVVELDSDYYKLIGDFDERFPPARPRCASAADWRSTATSLSAATWR